MPAVRIAAFILLTALSAPPHAAEGRAAQPAEAAPQRTAPSGSTGQDPATARQDANRDKAEAPGPASRNTAKPAEPGGNSAKPAEPALDLEALEKRLKETDAIGLFTKITLKNEVDDLLERFRAYYEGRSDTPPDQLRQPYEMLILKVLTLLQDGDPALARTIADSREAIWSILTDREKFAKL